MTLQTWHSPSFAAVAAPVSAWNAQRYQSHKSTQHPALQKLALPWHEILKDWPPMSSTHRPVLLRPRLPELLMASLSPAPRSPPKGFATAACRQVKGSTKTNGTMPAEGRCSVEGGRGRGHQCMPPGGSVVRCSPCSEHKPQQTAWPRLSTPGGKRQGQPQLSLQGAHRHAHHCLLLGSLVTRRCTGLPSTEGMVTGRGTDGINK